MNYINNVQRNEFQPNISTDTVICIVFHVTRLRRFNCLPTDRTNKWITIPFQNKNVILQQGRIE